MKRLILVGGLVSILATAQAASFASAHHTMKARVRVMANNAKTSAPRHHAKVACPITPDCNCD